MFFNLFFFVIPGVEWLQVYGMQVVGLDVLYGREVGIPSTGHPDLYHLPFLSDWSSTHQSTITALSCSSTVRNFYFMQLYILKRLIFFHH